MRAAAATALRFPNPRTVSAVATPFAQLSRLPLADHQGQWMILAILPDGLQPRGMKLQGPLGNRKSIAR
jgi:hypothetical protein